jgi:dCMP deaminase
VDWNDYFLGIADAVSQKSKDKKCPVGAVLVRDKLVIATGFNGMVRGVPDDPRILEDDDQKAEKLQWICHAEQNVISNAARLGACCVGAAIYVTKFPCFQCLQNIIQSGITTISTNDTAFWRNDPIDPSGDGKRYVIQESRDTLTIEAPRLKGLKQTRPTLAFAVRAADPTVVAAPGSRRKPRAQDGRHVHNRPPRPPRRSTNVR